MVAALALMGRGDAPLVTESSGGAGWLQAGRENGFAGGLLAACNL